MEAGPEAWGWRRGADTAAERRAIKRKTVARISKASRAPSPQESLGSGRQSERESDRQRKRKGKSKVEMVRVVNKK